MAEALLNYWGKARVRADSAGSHPKGTVHPLALHVLERHQLPIDNLRSKGWEEFSAAGAPPLHVVVTVCDRAAQEVCPIWPGQPITAHWGIADPVTVEGPDPERRRAFDTAFRELEARIKVVATLPLETLDRMSLQRQLEAIGTTAVPAGRPRHPANR